MDSAPPPPPPPPPGRRVSPADGAPPLPPRDATDEIEISPEPTPPAEGRSRRGLVIGVAALVAVAAAGGVVLWLTGDDDDADDDADDAGAGTTPGTQPATTGSDTTVAETTAAETTAPETSPAPTTTAVSPADAQAQLDALLVADKAIADSLVGTYVPQLAARYDGMVEGGITWGPSEILAEHTPHREAFGAILVDGGAYKFKLDDGQPMDGWYLTFVPEPFDDKSDATNWCKDNDVPRETCVGRDFKPPV